MSNRNSSHWRRQNVELRAAGFDPAEVVSRKAIVTVAAAYTNAHRCNNRVQDVAQVIIDALDVGVGYELLSGDEDGRFITPLATLHAFNGWTDKFIFSGTGNPPGGLEDIYLKLEFAFGDYLAEARYHDFQGDDSGDDIGQEINLRIGRPFGEHVRADLFFADFDAESDFQSTNLSDTTKFWLQLMVTF